MAQLSFKPWRPRQSRRKSKNAVRLRAADPGEMVQVTVVLRHRSGGDMAQQLLSGGKPGLSREEYAASAGADPADIARIEQFARGHGLQVVESNAAERRVVLSGTVAAMNSAFSVDLGIYQTPQGVHRSYEGAPSLPPGLAPIVAAVLGLDNRPVARH